MFIIQFQIGKDLSRAIPTERRRSPSRRVTSNQRFMNNIRGERREWGLYPAVEGFTVGSMELASGEPTGLNGVLTPCTGDLAACKL
jgi:hypothetical protein